MRWPHARIGGLAARMKIFAWLNALKGIFMGKDIATNLQELHSRLVTVTMNHRVNCAAYDAYFQFYKK
ncbi:hypothetical protein Sjap_023684 [Stephania japonica]|uniref:Uncharacterized protein n=1 Tax=Stephania japonica TaxID=461633 RepID=A0AAP0HMY4_9MAGN